MPVVKICCWRSKEGHPNDRDRIFHWDAKADWPGKGIRTYILCPECRHEMEETNEALKESRRFQIRKDGGLAP